MYVLFGNKMVSFKYKILITLISIYIVNTNAICQTNTTDNGNENGVTIFLESNYQGRNTILKPGNYLISELQNIKSIRIPKDFEVFLSDNENFDDESAERFSCPTVEELNNNTSVDGYKIDNIDTSKYKYLYVLKVDLNNEDGIADQNEYDANTCKYFGRHIKNIKELSTQEKEELIAIEIDNSPDFQGLPDLTQYKNLKDIKLLFNVLKNKDESFIKKEFDKIINYIDKVHPLRIVEMQGEIPSYEKTQNGKFFGFNLETIPNIPSDIREIHLINCKKLSNIDFSKYKNLQKLYMYGNTFESATEEQWKTMIEQIFNLALSNALIQVQLPKTFTGEIPKVGNSANSKIQYLSALGATSVAQDAFKNQQALRELYLPNVKEIKKEAFYHCFKMEKVSLDKCEVLREGAFRTNRALQSMHLPMIQKLEKLSIAYTRSNILKIGDLNDIDFKSKSSAGVYLPFCTELGQGALRGDQEDQVQFVLIDLPVCKKIEAEAMRHLKILKEVNIPEVETIGVSAFENDGELKKVGDIKNMSDNGIFLPKVKSIADYAFKNDDQYYVKDKIKAQNNTVKSIVLPECTSIGRDAFMRYRVLEKLSIPKCVSIGKLAFYDCYKLQKIEAPLLETIDDRVFLYASSPIKSFKTVNNNEEIDNFLEFQKLKRIGIQAFGGDSYHNMGQVLVKLPECTQMADNALQGSRIREIEAPKINNKYRVLLFTNSNITYNRLLLEI